VARVTIRVLVVEDSPAMRAFVRAALEEGGLDVSEARNGFEALRLLPRERFDLVVTDINMPDIHGLELIALMRKSDAHRTTPVIIVSTEGSERDRDRGMALGANAYLSKPFEPEALRDAVQRVLRGAADAPSAQ
jgi:two-component system chemotaxis response regulator CheY